MTNPNALHLGDRVLLRIAVGHEDRRDLRIDDATCPACIVRRGHRHERGCRLEQCPSCHDRLADCGCADQAGPFLEVDAHQHPTSRGRAPGFGA